MLGKNPFKMIEEENIELYREKGPSTPAFLTNRNDSSITNSDSSSGSPTFPSFY